MCTLQSPTSLVEDNAMRIKTYPMVVDNAMSVQSQPKWALAACVPVWSELVAKGLL